MCSYSHAHPSPSCASLKTSAIESLDYTGEAILSCTWRTLQGSAQSKEKKIPLFASYPSVKKLVISPCVFSSQTEKAGELELTSILRYIQTQTSLKSVVLSVEQFYFCKLWTTPPPPAPKSYPEPHIICLTWFSERGFTQISLDNLNRGGDWLIHIFSETLWLPSLQFLEKGFHITQRPLNNNCCPSCNKCC